VVDRSIPGDRIQEEAGNGTTKRAHLVVDCDLERNWGAWVDKVVEVRRGCSIKAVG